MTWTSKTEITEVAEAKLDVADEFEVGEEEMVVFLRNKTSDEDVWDEEEFFILFHAEDNNNRLDLAGVARW